MFDLALVQLASRRVGSKQTVILDCYADLSRIMLRILGLGSLIIRIPDELFSGAE